jgi:carbon monoxide dehydrogenase subunit G
MPTDSATKTIDVKAPPEEVLATLRDVESQAEWIPEILEAEVLEVYDDDGLPATARFKASATVGTDEYTLSYEHADDGMSWTMVSGKLQTGQEGRYTVAGAGLGSTVTYELTIHHNLPLPGFIRTRVIRGLVDSTLQGLKARLEGVTSA